ncbi:hypothetical protein TRV_03527 [Trichophyton verrucosum HKI 0517]|uniref:Uncharacterized protein n=1 Tax=Trichophyton verrucosum (strain HKI 0517) TaxID=663202 RepID=D4D8T9_TRIVH|nr:uncharacterized protein TRV_03527 [Trichophyton verrucosum HKI 0517]EFE41698.1 hypothetical protein TRV_03527 [Trichophyton verrucosum HKI 0517]
MSCLVYPQSPPDSVYDDDDDADANAEEEGRDEESLISFYRAATEIPEVAAW